MEYQDQAASLRELFSDNENLLAVNSQANDQKIQVIASNSDRISYFSIGLGLALVDHDVPVSVPVSKKFGFSDRILAETDRSCVVIEGELLEKPQRSETTASLMFISPGEVDTPTQELWMALTGVEKAYVVIYGSNDGRESADAMSRLRRNIQQTQLLFLGSLPRAKKLAWQVKPNRNLIKSYIEHEAYSCWKLLAKRLKESLSISIST